MSILFFLISSQMELLFASSFLKLVRMGFFERMPQVASTGCEIAYGAYFNQARPHQGIQQRIPQLSRSAISSHHAGDKLIALPSIGGLHHDYHWAA